MTKSINKKALIGIFIFCIARTATYMTMGILAKIMESYPEVSPVTVQSVLVGPTLVGTIFAFFVGTLNKTIPAKKILIFAQAGMLLYGLIFMFLGGRIPIYALILASGLAGFQQGSSNTILGLLMLGAVPDEKKRGSMLGIATAVTSIGGVIFMTGGGILAADRWQNAYILFFYFIAAAALELILLPNIEPEGKAKPQAATQEETLPEANMGKVWLLSVHFFVFYICMYVYGANCSEFVISTYKIGTVAQAGIAASCITVGGILAGFLYGAYSKVLKRFTVPVLIGISIIGLLIPVFITDNIIAFYLAGILLGIPTMGASPYIIAYLNELAPGAQYGKAMSIFSGFFNGGMVVAIYVIAFLTSLVCGDGSNIHYKFVVALAMDIIIFITSFFIYAGSDTKKEKGQA